MFFFGTIKPAVTGGVVERFASGHPKITRTVSAAPVTAGRLVESTGNRTVQHTGANSLKCVGVAMQTADAINDKIAVATGGVWNLRASGAIAAGDYIKCGAAGVAVAIAADGDPRLIIGMAEEAIIDTADGPVRLML